MPNVKISHMDDKGKATVFEDLRTDALQVILEQVTELVNKLTLANPLFLPDEYLKVELSVERVVQATGSIVDPDSEPASIAEPPKDDLFPVVTVPEEVPDA